MAKATKAPEKKGTKPTVKTASKAAPAKASKPPAKAAAAAKPAAKAAVPSKPAVASKPALASKPAPAPAKAAPAKNGKRMSEPPPKPRSAVPESRGAEPKGKAEPRREAVSKVDTSTLHAHPEAKLSQKEIVSLFNKLIEEKSRVINGFDRHVQEALSDDDVLADEIDIAQRSTDQAWLFRFADKERKLLIEIDAAIEKMRNGDYGICEGTDEAIGFKRLELRPWTRYSVAYKEMLEREKAQQAR
jgi:DnaK suppressor protein